MKNWISISSLLGFTFIIMLQAGVSSCTKDHTIYDTVTVHKTDTLDHTIYDTIIVNKTDTLIIKDTAISLELLTANAWKMQEIRGVIGSEIIFYQRGGTTNTENYDNEFIRFNADNTGSLYDANGAIHQIVWAFSNEAKTKITFVVSNPAPLESQTVIYENVRYKNKALLFDQYWTYNNVNSHVQVIRIPANL